MKKTLFYKKTVFKIKKTLAEGFGIRDQSGPQRDQKNSFSELISVEVLPK